MEYELYNEIRKVDAKVKVCFLTGSELCLETLRRSTVDFDANCLISKPLSIEDLVRKVKRQIEPQ
jgi:FixJ family two-component response regulator